MEESTFPSDCLKVFVHSNVKLITLLWGPGVNQTFKPFNCKVLNVRQVWILYLGQGEQLASSGPQRIMLGLCPSRGVIQIICTSAIQFRTAVFLWQPWACCLKDWCGKVTQAHSGQRRKQLRCLLFIPRWASSSWLSQVVNKSQYHRQRPHKSYSFSSSPS